MAKYLNEDGLLYLWSKIKGKLANKVDVESGKGLSTNDYTTAEKTKLSGIATGANKTTVTNSLTSTSTSAALSAAQGKALNDALINFKDEVENAGYGDMHRSTYDADGDGVVDKAKTADSATSASSADNADMLGDQLPSYYAPASSVPTKTSQLANDSGFLTSHQNISGKLDKTGDGSSVVVNFTAASSRANVATGEKLSILLGKIAKYFSDLKAVAFSGSYNDLSNKPTIPTVTNDLTNDRLTKLTDAYTLANENADSIASHLSSHAPANAQANVIETVKVNGTALSVSGKAVNITVPTKISSFSDAGNYALKSDLSYVFKYCGSVATYADLSGTASTVVGSVYNVEDTGMNYVLDAEQNWDALGSIFTIDSITTAEIDTVLNS